MNVQFKIKGSKVSSSQVAKALADSAQKNIEKDLKKTIRACHQLSQITEEAR